ncbi:unnamed protein product [Cylicostephanus goldi]|uniref:NOT2/NOT3/NOT5 C-terminal domain-containing protein n=1 Tax=Cylicostephanus goldi TaxID=71465 RepID=A0A3P7NI21_CYLGO|nr:unnamed protein product [Cylicostephanus goldi]
MFLSPHSQNVPDDYLTNAQIREKLPPVKLNKLSEDVLFYLFYNCPGETFSPVEEFLKMLVLLSKCVRTYLCIRLRICSRIAHVTQRKIDLVLGMSKRSRVIPEKMSCTRVGSQKNTSLSLDTYQRDWRFHKSEGNWLTRSQYGGVKEQTGSYEKGQYNVFDPLQWRKVNQNSFLCRFFHTFSPL